VKAFPAIGPFLKIIFQKNRSGNATPYFGRFTFFCQAEAITAAINLAAIS
jgi:hypothetical protein